MAGKNITNPFIKNANIAPRAAPCPTCPHMVCKSVLFATLASLVAAAPSNQTCSTQVNATSQSDLDAINGCSVFYSSIVIGGDAGVLQLNGVQNVTGDITIINATSLTSFSAPSLAQIAGTLDLELLTILDTLSMPLLTDLGGIKLLSLPALTELQFNAGVANAKNVFISDTSLESLDGLNLSSVQNFDVNNNKNIKDITIDATSISELLDVSFNSEDVNVSMPNLIWANNATFRYVASVYMPNLTYVNQSLGFINNTFYDLSADNLESVGGTFIISSNPNLQNASFSSLSKVGGGFVVANNSQYSDVDGFPSLKTVGGAIDMVGNLTNASFPDLNEVDGGVTVDSDNVFNCSVFNEAHANGDFHGDAYVCKGKETTISTTLQSTSIASSLTSTSSGSATTTDSASATATSSSSSSSKSTSSSKSKNGAAAASAGILGPLAALLFQFL